MLSHYPPAPSPITCPPWLSYTPTGSFHGSRPLTQPPFVAGVVESPAAASVTMWPFKRAETLLHCRNAQLGFSHSETLQKLQCIWKYNAYNAYEENMQKPPWNAFYTHDCVRIFAVHSWFNSQLILIQLAKCLSLKKNTVGVFFILFHILLCFVIIQCKSTTFFLGLNHESQGIFSCSKYLNAIEKALVVSLLVQYSAEVKSLSDVHYTKVSDVSV